MAVNRWTLLDPDAAGPAGGFDISASELPGTPVGWRVTKRTLWTGLSLGVDIVEIDNGLLKAIIVPTRGMGLWHASIDGRELGWRSPVRGPVHPAFVPIAEPSGVGWLSGFDELMCRCGLESSGAPDFDDRGQLLFPLHGRIANRPAHQLELMVDDVAGTISLSGVVEESRFHFQKLRLRTTYITRFGTSRIDWHDEVENFGGSTAKMQMLYHTNIGQPQLDSGSTLLAPIDRVAPGNSDTAEMGTTGWDRYTPPDARFRQQVYLLGLRADGQGDTSVLLKNSTGSSGVQLSFNTRQLPCFSLWRNLVPAADGYVTGLEPGTNFPNPRTMEEKAGRVICLQSGEKWKADLSLDWFLSKPDVAHAEQSIAELQGSCQPVILSTVVA
jgi:Domain of unknown function (DUF4432)